MPRQRKPGEFGPITARDKAQMRCTQADAEWFASLPPEELRRLSGKYVAVKDKRVVAASRTLSGLSRCLDKDKLDCVFIQRVEEPMTVVY